MAFHSEAINRLCFACGNIIDPSLLSNICEAFASNTAVIENISPRNLCHTCCRVVKHFPKKPMPYLLQGSETFHEKNEKGICYRISKSIIDWLPPTRRQRL